MSTFGIELWLAYDENGNYVVAEDEETMVERWADDVGGAYMVRRLALSVPLQTIPMSTATLPALPEGELEVREVE